MTQTVSVTLADHWLVYLQGLVRDQRFASLDDAIESGVRLLEADGSAEDRLARLLDEGERSGDAGVWNLDSFLAEAHEHDADRQAA